MWKAAVAAAGAGGGEREGQGGSSYPHRVGVQGGLERVLEGLLQAQRGRGRRARVLARVRGVADGQQERAPALACL